MKKFTHKIRSFINAVYWEYRNLHAGWPGRMAKKYGMVVGHIGCPNCGVGVSGIIDKPICKWCGKGFWDEIKNERRRT